MKLVSFSNKRQSTGVEQGMFLYVSQTESKVRITDKVAKAMKVTSGDYVAVGMDAETDKTYLYVGVKTDDAQVGNKLAGTGSTLEFMSKNVWDELGGDSGHNLKYEVAEEAVEFDGTLYWEVSNKEVLPARTRTAKGENEAEEVVESTTVTNDAINGADEGFSLD